MKASSFFNQLQLVTLTALSACSTTVGIAGVSNETEKCQQSLSAVFRTIQEYRHKHHQLPKQLDELVSGQLSRVALLVCPTAPHARYAYEFEPRALTNALARNLDVTLRSWREWQMGLLGSEVPMVRCTNHAQVLNLSFGGAIYESGPDWEDRFSALVQKQNLSLETLLSEHVRLEVLRIPARDPGTPAELIDLTEYYNGSLKGWLEGSPEENLTELSAGQTQIGGLPFDVRGVIQLGSRANTTLHRPAAASNIVVGLQCPGLVFLHGTVHAEAPGNIIGQYVIHFEDGSTNVFSIYYGRQLLDWRINPPDNRKLDNTTAIWSESNPGDSPPKKVAHLYATRWHNPQPRIRIHHIDFVSVWTLSSPFLVALTAEAVEAPNSKAGDTPINKKQ